ncbi:hypothetical protein [Butyrivibrio sp. INlla16]|uniref:hypothetical protein n=1 Tax=Butyrivibrio sp. INlla16 TaxID=1520807 RepID=UPI00088A94AC|nr:hypothetical protein [Butyrivibrio sp. INlla16]SDB69837.1 hypothetical protein SAMN02910263_04550 [Butyrivibrio sp. INlla16]
MRKNQFKCEDCGKTINITESLGNIIVYCPDCHKYIRCLCDYGFGPVAPCDIFCGLERIGLILGEKGRYKLVSRKYGIEKDLVGGYKNLACYEEATKILEEYMNKS